MRSSSQKSTTRRATASAPHRRLRQQPPEPREAGRPARTAKDINVVRGDDRPQAVRYER